MTVLTLNKAAVAAFDNAEKIRVKAVDGTLFVRPTARKAGVNLPKGQKLVNITRTGANARVAVEGVDASAGNFGLIANKYGWFVLADASPSKTAPAIKVAA